MKDTVDVAIVQFVPAPLDAAANRERMVEAVHAEARRGHRDLVIFPELATTGYVPLSLPERAPRRLAEESDTIPGPTTRALGEAAKETGAYVAAGLSELDADGRIFNSVALISPAGEVVAVHRKVHLYKEELEHFDAGDRFDVVDTELGRLGLSICYDSRFPESSRAQALAGAEILICVFAYAQDPGVPVGILTYRSIVRAWENSAFYVLANRAGTEAGVTFIGGSVVAGPTGQILSGPSDAVVPVVRARLASDAIVEAGRLERERRADVYGDLAPSEGVSA